jgi:hypothetical protein
MALYRPIWRLYASSCCVLLAVASTAPSAQRTKSFSGSTQLGVTHPRSYCEPSVVVRPLALDASRSVTVDASSLVVTRDTLLVLGTPTLVWTRARNGAPTASANSPASIGILSISGSGVRLLPSPISDVRYPRGARLKHTWEVVFARDSQDNVPPRQQMLSLWSGSFDGQRWSDVRQIARVGHQFIRADDGPTLVTLGDDLFFAFGFERPQKSRTTLRNQGIVLLRRHSGVWTADTLETWESPTHVQLSVNRGQLDVTFIQAYFEEQRTWPSSVFTVTYEGKWGVPKRLVGDRALPQRWLALRHAVTQDGGGTTVSWQRKPFDSSVVSLIAQRFPLGRPPLPEVTIGDQQILDNFAVVPLPHGGTAWFMRSGASRDSMVVTTANPEGRIARSLWRIPNHTMRPLAVLAGDSVALLVTGGIEQLDGQGVPGTYLSRVSIACSTTAAGKQ